MPDVAKGLMLLELLVACDPDEAAESVMRIGNAVDMGVAEKISIVGIKDRWQTPTVGGWSDVLITFTFVGDPTDHICEVQLVHADMMRVRKQMGAHKGYSKFRWVVRSLYLWAAGCFGVGSHPVAAMLAPRLERESACFARACGVGVLYVETHGAVHLNWSLNYLVKSTLSVAHLFTWPTPGRLAHTWPLGTHPIACHTRMQVRT
jgi:hypothetical protein